MTFHYIFDISWFNELLRKVSFLEQTEKLKEQRQKNKKTTKNKQTKGEHGP